MLASVPAMWFVPALLMLTAPMPAMVAAGLFLIANTTRLLVSRGAPRALIRSFSGAAGTAPAVSGALGFQLGICAACAGYALAAAGLFVFSSAIWTLSALARGSLQPVNQRKLPHAIFSIAATAILATLLSAGTFETQGGQSEPEASLFETTQTLLHRLTYAPLPPAQRTRTIATPLAKPKKTLGAAGISGVPGVVLRPDRSAERQHIFLSAGQNRFSLPRSLSFPFTGEYHLFLVSSRQVPPDAVIHPGTPLDEAYLATTGSALETEGYQALTPPIDFHDCGKVLLTISNGEKTPASASMRLVTAGLEVDLGTEIFGLDPSAKETLDFTVPALRRGSLVAAMRVLFRRDPAHQDQSVRVRHHRLHAGAGSALVTPAAKQRSEPGCNSQTHSPASV